MGEITEAIEEEFKRGISQAVTSFASAKAYSILFDGFESGSQALEIAEEAWRRLNYGILGIEVISPEYADYIRVLAVNHAEELVKNARCEFPVERRDITRKYESKVRCLIGEYLDDDSIGHG